MISELILRTTHGFNCIYKARVKEEEDSKEKCRASECAAFTPSKAIFSEKCKKEAGNCIYWYKLCSAVAESANGTVPCWDRIVTEEGK